MAFWRKKTESKNKWENNKERLKIFVVVDSADSSDTDSDSENKPKQIIVKGLGGIGPRQLWSIIKQLTVVWKY